MAAARGDLFTTIHKGLRSMIYSLSGRLQTHDFGDVEATRALITDLESDFAIARSAGCIVCVLNSHAAEEETVIFPPASRLGNGLVPQLVEEHHALTRRELALAEEAHALLSMGAAEERVTAGMRLNRNANELFGAYLTHMNREETELVPLMQQHFTDEQMGTMRSAIIGKMPPDRLFVLLSWMLPSLNVSELSNLTRLLRESQFSDENE
ncbi:MAG: hemerythrin domain-containing protein [Thermoplasmata archaeon]